MSQKNQLFATPPGSPLHRGSRGSWLSFYWRRISGQLKKDVPSRPKNILLPKEEIQGGLKRMKGSPGLTWLGHASFLLHLAGKNVLIDPFLSDYATGRPPLGPKRYTPPALTVDELPPIDVLLVSHCHYDHLDAPTIEALPGKENIQVVVPEGLGAFFRSRGYECVSELPWHEARHFDGLKVTVVPAVHGSARTLWDRDQTHWCGFLLEAQGRSVYHSGDTAYGATFKEMGKRYGPIDFGLLPIGAYEPRDLMADSHVNPEEAMQIALDLKVKTFVSMHWGTIVLTDEPQTEPVERFLKAGSRAGYDEKDLWVLKVGESRGLI